MVPFLLPPVPGVRRGFRALFLLLFAWVSVLAAPGAALGVAAATSSCMSLTLELQEYCSTHPDAGQAEFDRLCRENAGTAYCNCMKVQCVGVVRAT